MQRNCGDRPDGAASCTFVDGETGRCVARDFVIARAGERDGGVGAVNWLATNFDGVILKVLNPRSDILRASKISRLLSND